MTTSPSRSWSICSTNGWSSSRANAKYQGNVIYVDCRNTVGNKTKWFDEIHPRDPGFSRVAGKFKTAIDKALKGVA